MARVFFPLVIGLEAGDVFWSDESDLWDFCPLVTSDDDPPDAGAQRLAAYQARITAAWGIVTTETRLVTLMAQIAELPTALAPVPIGDVPWAEDWAWDDPEAAGHAAVPEQEEAAGDPAGPGGPPSGDHALLFHADPTTPWKPQD